MEVFYMKLEQKLDCCLKRVVKTDFGNLKACVGMDKIYTSEIEPLNFITSFIEHPETHQLTG